MGEMSPDDTGRATIRGRLDQRTYLLPPWLVRLAEVEAYRTVEMVHVLGDGDDVFVGVRLPGGQELTVTVYIDHNLGTLVKDAFVVPGPVAELLRLMQGKIDDPDTAWNDIDPADAAARITDAIAAAVITYPRFESDTWPACRPLVEWVVRHLPDGGTGYQRPEWSEEALEALAGRFWASTFGSGLDDADHRALLDSFLWSGPGTGRATRCGGARWQWKLLLVDWIPRKLASRCPTWPRRPISYASSSASATTNGASARR